MKTNIECYIIVKSLSSFNIKKTKFSYVTKDLIKTTWSITHHFDKTQNLDFLGYCCCLITKSCPTESPWTAACQASLSFSIIQSLLKLISIESVMPSHPLSSPSPATFNLSQLQGLFQWVSSSQQVARVLEFQLQHQSFKW